MRRILSLLALAALFGGCSLTTLFPPSPRATPSQALRDEVYTLRETNAALENTNRRLTYDLENTRIELQKADEALKAKGLEPAPTTAAFEDYEISSIAFGILTGVSDWDNDHVLNGIMVYLKLKDAEGDTLKRKGNVLFDLIDVSDRRQKIIMSWAIPAETFGRMWGSVPPGFRIKLPWQGQVPWGDETVLRATFVDARGRQFTQSKVIRLPMSSYVKDDSSPDVDMGPGDAPADAGNAAATDAGEDGAEKDREAPGPATTDDGGAE